MRRDSRDKTVGQPLWSDEELVQPWPSERFFPSIRALTSLSLNLVESPMGTGWSFPALASLQMVVRLVASIWTTCETRSRRSSGPLALSLNLYGDLQQSKMVSLSIKERVWSSSRADSMRRWMEASMGLLSLKSANPTRRRDIKSKRPPSALAVELPLQIAGDGDPTGFKMGLGEVGRVTVPTN